MEKVIQLNTLSYENFALNKSKILTNDSERYRKVQARGKFLIIYKICYDMILTGGISVE